MTFYPPLQCLSLLHTSDAIAIAIANTRVKKTSGSSAVAGQNSLGGGQHGRAKPKGSGGKTPENF